MGETHCAPISSPVVQWPSAVIPRTGAVSQYPGGYILAAPWRGSTDPSEETSEGLCVRLHLYDGGKRRMKVHCVLLLLISAGKGVPAIALKGGFLLPKRVGPGLCIYISMSKRGFQEQPVLLVRFYERIKSFKEKLWSALVAAQIFVISGNRCFEPRSLCIIVFLSIIFLSCSCLP